MSNVINSLELSLANERAGRAGERWSNGWKIHLLYAGIFIGLILSFSRDVNCFHSFVNTLT